MACDPHAAGAHELVLIALRARTGGIEPSQGPETSRWLQAIRIALFPRLPLGTRLVVRAPDYRPFTLQLAIEAQPRRDPAGIRSAVLTALKKAFALAPRGGQTTRPLGVRVTSRDIAGIVRKIPGVLRATTVHLVVDGQVTDLLEVGRSGLPRLDLSAPDITVTRAAAGAGG